MGAVLAYIGRLYAVEKRARQAGIEGEDLRWLRQEVASPVASELHAYLLKIQPELLPKSDAAKQLLHPEELGRADALFG